MDCQAEEQSAQEISLLPSLMLVDVVTNPSIGQTATDLADLVCP